MLVYPAAKGKDLRLTLCCLHGLFGRPEHWAGLRESLGARWPVVAPALPLTAEAAREGVPGMTRHVAAWLSARGAWRVVLVGNSLGGHVALDFALRYPRRVAGVVLAGSAGLLERTFARGVPASPSRAFIRTRVEEVFFDPALVTEALVGEVHEYLRDRRNVRASVAWARATKAYPMGGRLGAVRAPALLLWGEHDRITPLAVARTFLAGLPHGRLVTIPACGHAPMLEAPGPFAEEVARFLADLERRHAPAGPSAGRAAAQVL